MKFRIHRLAGILLASWLLLCPAVWAREAISLTRAVEIARDAARAADIDIEHYAPSSRAPVQGKDGRVWLIGFVRSDTPWRPGSELIVEIDRFTGNAEVLLGQ